MYSQQNVSIRPRSKKIRTKYPMVFIGISIVLLFISPVSPITAEKSAPVETGKQEKENKVVIPTFNSEGVPYV